MTVLQRLFFFFFLRKFMGRILVFYMYKLDFSHLPFYSVASLLFWGWGEGGLDNPNLWYVLDTDIIS